MSQVNIGSLGDAAGANTVPIADVINGSARAWVNFNGTGTVAIRADYNVDSITDNGTGNYTVNLTNNLTDANYSVVTATEPSGVTNYAAGIANLATGSVDILTDSSSGANTDLVFICASIFR